MKDVNKYVIEQQATKWENLVLELGLKIIIFKDKSRISRKKATTSSGSIKHALAGAGALELQPPRSYRPI